MTFEQLRLLQFTLRVKHELEELKSLLRRGREEREIELIQLRPRVSNHLVDRHDN